MIFEEPTVLKQCDRFSPNNLKATFSRHLSSYKNLSTKFSFEKLNHYDRQYAHLYSSRLIQMQSNVVKRAKELFGDEIPVRKLFELKVDECCIVVGTIFKRMDLQPSILKEVSEEYSLMPPPSRVRFDDVTDEILLEDELQRIQLIGNIDVSQYVTGIVVAVLGREKDSERGKFVVEKCCFQCIPSQIPAPVINKDSYLCFVSGFELGSSDIEKSSDPLSLQLLTDYITGQLGSAEDQRQNSLITRVIICGNSLAKETQDKAVQSKAKYLTKKNVAGSVEAVKLLDDVLTQLSASVDVDLMPGDFDPANHVLPQQPLHTCMFPLASNNTTMHSVTNPYEFNLDGFHIMGTSGQPINNIYAYSGIEDRVKILENTLLWGHLCPSAPDNLGCYPYESHDPFILTSTPHVYFAGNQPKFQQGFFQGADGQRVRLVCVPRFCTTRSCVLLNMRTLECHQLSVDASLRPPSHPSTTISS